MSDKYEFITDEYLRNLPDDPLEGLKKLFDDYLLIEAEKKEQVFERLLGLMLYTINNIGSNGTSLKNLLNNIIVAYGQNNTNFKTSNVTNSLSAFKKELDQVYVIHKTNIYAVYYKQLLNPDSDSYILEKKDCKSIQKLLTDLREIIVNSDLGDEHKKKVIRKVREFTE